VDVVKRGQYSEIKESESSIPFDQWWNKSLDIIDDWNRLKDNIPIDDIPDSSSQKRENQPYQQAEKTLNEKVYKKLLNLKVVDESISAFVFQTRINITSFRILIFYSCFCIKASPSLIYLSILHSFSYEFFGFLFCELSRFHKFINEIFFFNIILVFSG